MSGIIFENKKTKELTNKKPIAVLDKVEAVSISLSDNAGLSAVACVKIGQRVLKGEQIGKANGKFSANVFASISGTVHAIEQRLCDDGKLAQTIVIVSDHKNETKKFKPCKDLTSKGISKAIFDAGIVGLGGAKYPTHLKFEPGKKIEHLLINGAECEDYITCDDVLMQKYAKEILEGAKLCAKVFGLKTFTVAIESDKTLAIEKMEAKAKSLKGAVANIKIVPTKFPIGFEKMLVKKALGIKLSQTQYPAEEGVMVTNVATCFAVYQAVKEGKPLFERVVTVSGGAIKNPQNFLIPNGTQISNILLACGGEKFEQEKLFDYENTFNEVFSSLEDDKADIEKEKDALKELKEEDKIKTQKAKIKKMKAEFRKKKGKSMKSLKAISIKIQKEFANILAKVVCGGIMTGNSVEKMDVGIGKATGCVLFLNRGEVDFAEPSPCIKCGKCSKVCPAGLFPNKIEAEGLKNNFEACKKLNIGACINCGCCSFVCPARRELLFNIKDIKRKMKEARNGK